MIELRYILTLLLHTLRCDATRLIVDHFFHKHIALRCNGWNHVWFSSHILMVELRYILTTTTLHTFRCDATMKSCTVFIAHINGW